MDFTQDYFQLLSVPQQYNVDKALLSTHYRQLQKQFHPDKFAAKSANEQRLAVQFAAYINTAYQTLKSSVMRAEYLLLLAGEEVDHQSTTIADGKFLFLQMEWREALADISAMNNVVDAENHLDELSRTVKTTKSELEVLFSQEYESHAMQAAKNTIAKLHFVEKMLHEIETIESSLFD